MLRSSAMNGQSKRVAAVGECMIELTETGPGTMRRRYGGDTLNTAVYMARLGVGLGIAVDYVTALGDDPLSDEMLACWQAEGVGTERVARLPGRLPGLYLIKTDSSGERSFWYWRSASAARDLTAPPHGDAALGSLAGDDLVYVSGITLSILDDPGRERLLAAVAAARAEGARIAADTNWRPRNWPDIEAGRHWTARLFAHADIALPSAEDDVALFGDATPEGTVARLTGLGIAEVVVKNGADGCILAHDGYSERIPATPVELPVDTTAAGDSFNAAYLMARMAGQDPATAALSGHRLATAVIGHPGAIIPREAMPDFDWSPQ